MQVLVNNLPQQVEEATTVEQLIEQLAHASPDFAIAVNSDFIPKSQYQTVQLNEGDRIELLTPMQGG